MPTSAPPRLRLDAFPVHIPDGFVPPPAYRRPASPGGPPRLCPASARPIVLFGGGFRALRRHGDRLVRHSAVDLMAGEGAVIVAALAGIVPHEVSINVEGKPVVVPGVTSSPRGGNVCWIYNVAQSVLLYHAHAREPFSLALGADVAAGEALGYVGRTGNATGPAPSYFGCPHLHFQVRRGPHRFDGGRLVVLPSSRFVDPEPELHRLFGA